MHLLNADPDRGRTFEIVCCVTSEPTFAEEVRVERRGVPTRSHDIRAFYDARKAPLGRRPGRPRGVRSRDRGDPEAVLAAADPDRPVISIVLSEPMLAAFSNRILNLHFADLTLRTPDGEPGFPGIRAVRDALAAGCTETRATVHLVTSAVDAGPPLVRSWAFPVSPMVEDAQAWPATDHAARLRFAHEQWMMRACSGPLWSAALQLRDLRRARSRSSARRPCGSPVRALGSRPSRRARCPPGRAAGDGEVVDDAHPRDPARMRSRPSPSIGRRASTRWTSPPRRTSAAPACNARAIAASASSCCGGCPACSAAARTSSSSATAPTAATLGYLAPGAARGGYGERFKQILEYIHSTISEIRRAPKPFIAAVDGVAAAGGFGIAMCCDLVLASTRASFEWAYPKTGLTGAESSTFLLPRLIGWRRAMELMLLNPRLGATQALDYGLVTAVYDVDRFDAAVADDRRAAGGRAAAGVRDRQGTAEPVGGIRSARRAPRSRDRGAGARRRRPGVRAGAATPSSRSGRPTFVLSVRVDDARVQHRPVAVRSDSGNGPRAQRAVAVRRVTVQIGEIAGVDVELLRHRLRTVSRADDLRRGAARDRSDRRRDGPVPTGTAIS